MINDAVILQQIYAQTWGSLNIASSSMNNMLRMTYLRHTAYAATHKTDYVNITGDIYPNMLSECGSWAKVGLIKEYLAKGYEYVFWIDADAAIEDFDTDLRDAVKDVQWGACEHDPDKSEYLRSLKVPKHINVGVMYIKNTKDTKRFVDAWIKCYPGEPGWAEQGSFNKLITEMPGIVKKIDDKWNATLRVNEVEKPVVRGFHGLPYPERYKEMINRYKDDPLIYRV